MAGRHPLGARGRRRARRPGGVGAAQRLARLRGRLAAHLPGQHPDDIAAAWTSLTARGLAASSRATAAGLALRQQIEDDTDRLTALPWHLLGASATLALAESLEPPCQLLLQRVDQTAGENYQPASRIRPPR